MAPFQTSGRGRGETSTTQAEGNEPRGENSRRPWGQREDVHPVGRGAPGDRPCRAWQPGICAMTGPVPTNSRSQLGSEREDGGQAVATATADYLCKKPRRDQPLRDQQRLQRQVLVLRDGPAASVTRSHALAPNLAGPALRLHQGEEEESMLRRFQSHAVTRPGHSALPGRHQDVWLPP